MRSRSRSSSYLGSVLVCALACSKPVDEPRSDLAVANSQQDAYARACKLAEEVVSKRELQLEQRVALLQERAHAEGLMQALTELIDAAEGDREAKDLVHCAPLVQMVEMRRSGRHDTPTEHSDPVGDLEMMCAQFEQALEQGTSYVAAAIAISEKLRTEEGRNVFEALAHVPLQQRAQLFEHAAKEVGAPDLECSAIAAFDGFPAG